MAAIVGSQRGRVGSLLVAIGAFLLVFATVIFVTAAPALGVPADPFPINDCGEGADAGLKIQWDIDDEPPTFTVDEFEGTGLPGDMDFGNVYDGPPNFTLVYDYADEDSTGWYLDYEYTGSTYDLYAIFFKTGGNPPENDQYVTPVPNPGTLELPNKLSHVTFCFQDATGGTTTTVADTTTTTVVGGPTTTVADTTTTTVADTTTTTVGGPEEPTTTVLGPDDPELPNNGPGQLLAIFLGGLGLLFMGSGSLVIASERRLTIR
ncbi:MAG: hypothetical protein Q8Q29_07545 [Actinomycetota bacterium]|nr:hypothetical protein [Actinomycetota bacterium]